ncbi:class I SAM-dependent methyltransferase [Altererythrobacter sp. MF3-039]|uniref:class I SAM-dependent methyltransferase n=1 Tax=Altererythrobacter sp. MF3-039 TaxID=3252901 RepID=UPI00390C6117
MTTNLSSPPADTQFWDRIAPKYAGKPIKDVPAYRAMLDCVLQSLRPSDRVLELGCGTGGTALLLAQAVEHITATDVSGEMIRIARSKLGQNAPDNIEFRQADAAEMIAPEAFDAIFATSLLHLVSDVPLVLEQAFEQLKPGGLLITKTVCLKHMNPMIRAMVTILSLLGFAPRVTKLSLADLEAEFDRAEFVIEQVEYFGKNRFNPFIIARRSLV